MHVDHQMHDLTWITIGLSCLLPLIKWLLDHTIFSVMGQLLFLRHKLVPKASMSKKLNEAFWKLSCYLIFFAMTAYNVCNKAWFWGPTRDYWIDWPNHQDTGVLQLICCLQLAFYVSGSVLLMFEVSRKDQMVMGLHHLMTCVLISLCLLCNFTRMGSVILLLHDANDVIMEMAKICSYTARHKIANCLFVFFIVCWFILRLLVFPVIILRSTIFESYNVIGPALCEAWWPSYYVINGLFVLLYVIHLYWFKLILTVARRMTKTGKAEDVREEVED